MNLQKKIFVTGGSGFVGSALLKRLAEEERYQIVASSRQPEPSFSKGVTPFHARSFSAMSAEKALENARIVVHLAARVHVMDDRSADPLAEFRAVNVDDTLSLAAAAARSGVERFYFISSIKVNGESTAPGRPFQAEDVPCPLDDYGKSKMEAEEGLRLIARQTGMKVTIIRPPLVYGPGVKANFYNMMRWLEKGIPLPFGSINNRRSLIALDNLVDFICTVVENPAADNETFLVSDGEDLSTTDLLRRMSRALEVHEKLLPVPVSLIRLAAGLAGRQALAQRLCDSLQVDVVKTRELLSWHPPVSVDETLARTAEHYRASKVT